MKKALLILVAVAFCINTFAQQGLQIGLEGGPTSNWLINKNDSDSPIVKNKTGGARGFFGLTADYHFLNTLGVGLEFVYALQGSAYDGYDIHANYFKIPLVLNFNSNPEDHVVMFVGKLGPYLAVNTAGKVVPNNSAFPTVDVKDQFNHLNVGMLLGLGIGFNIKNVVVINASLRLDAQLNDAIISNPNPAEFTNYGNTTRDKTWNLAGGLEIGAKYIIPTGGKSSSHSKSKSSYHRR